MLGFSLLLASLITVAFPPHVLRHHSAPAASPIQQTSASARVEYQYMAVCTDGDGALTSWLSSFADANSAGKAHEVATKGHRWVVVSREVPEGNARRVNATEAVRAVGAAVGNTRNVAGVVGSTPVSSGKPILASALRATTAKAAVGTCQGNACGDVAVDWTGHGYHISNHGSRRVLVRIRFTFFLQCLDPSDIHLNPGGSADYGNGAFCDPYTANYE